MFKYRKNFKGAVLSYNFILISLPILILSLFFIIDFSKSVEKNKYQAIKDIFYQANQTMDNNLKNLTNILSSVDYNRPFIDLIRMDKKYATAYENIKNQYTIEQTLKSIYRNVDYLDNMVLYTDTDIYVANDDKAYSYRNEIIHEPWYRQLVNKEIDYYIADDYVVNKSGLSKPQFIYAKRFYDYVNLEYLGVLLVSINMNSIYGILDRIQLDHEIMTLLVGRSKKILYTNNMDADFKAEFARLIENGDKLAENITIGDGNYLQLNNTNSFSEWSLVFLIPDSYMLKDVRSMQTYVVSVIALVLIFAAILSVLITYKITKPIKNLIGAMNQVSSGHLLVKLGNEKYEEFNILKNTFNNMTQKLHLSMNEIKMKEREKQKLQMHVLESQINPHFLYNTLDAIKWIAVIQNDHKVSHMIASLVKLLQISIHIKNDFITLEQEIDYLKNYLKLIEIRYNSRININYMIDDNALEYKTLKLVLQPIVENAIFHGFADGDKVGEIIIKCQVTEDMLVITVSDNGVGFDPSKPRNKKKSNFSGIGLNNIDERIKMFCGESFGIKITSEINKGTTVEICQPLMKGEDELDTCNDCG